MNGEGTLALMLHVVVTHVGPFQSGAGIMCTTRLSVHIKASSSVDFYD